MSDLTFVSTEQPEAYITGHIRNLTKEQSALLRLFWKCLFLLQDLDNLDGATVDDHNSKSGAKIIDSVVRFNNFKEKLKEYDVKHSSTTNGATSNSKSYGSEYFELVSSLESYEPGELRKLCWSFIAADDPDITILRFLRARKWNVEKSLTMFTKTLKWMTSFGVGDILEKGEEGLDEDFKRKGVKGFMKQLTSGKSFIRGTDKNGRPICYINVRYHKKDEQPQEVLQKFTIYMMETTRLMVQEPVETGCLVFNMTDFSLSNMDFQYVKFMIQCFEAYYPESLGILIIHKAPWVFGQVWKLIAPLLDPVVASKIRFTKEDKDLLAFIPETHLIEELGGKDKRKYEYVPSKPDENYRMKDETTKAEKTKKRKSLELEFENLTKQWLENPDDEIIKKERDQKKVHLRQIQLELDPYIRARTLYHRVGILKEDSTCDWGYSEKTSK